MRPGKKSFHFTLLVPAASGELRFVRTEAEAQAYLQAQAESI
jgi:hypothetical protein